MSTPDTRGIPATSPIDTVPVPAGPERGTGLPDAAAMVGLLDVAVQQYESHIASNPADRTVQWYWDRSRPQLDLWDPKDRSRTLKVYFPKDYDPKSGEPWGRVDIVGVPSIDGRRADTFSLARAVEDERYARPASYSVRIADGHEDSRAATAKEAKYVESILTTGTPERPRLTAASAAKFVGRSLLRGLRGAMDTLLPE